MNDDIVTLGGQAFPIKGPIVSNAVSEYEAGLKVGKVSYDNREHAFFLVLEDFTGGFGQKQLDIRTELGTYWYADPDTPPELAFSGRVMLPLSQTFVAINEAPEYFSMEDNVGYPYLECDEWYLFGLGSGHYTLAGLGEAPIKRPPHGFTKTVISFARTTETPTGGHRIYMSFQDGGDYLEPYWSRDEGASWAVANPYFIKEPINIVPGKQGDILLQQQVHSYPTGTSIEFFEKANAPDGVATETNYAVNIYGVKLPGAFNHFCTLAELITRPVRHLDHSGTSDVEDIFYWDGKLLGQANNTRIVFLVPAYGVGNTWAHIPAGEFVEGISYQPVDSVLGRELTDQASLSTNGGATVHVDTDADQPDIVVTTPTFTTVWGYVVTATWTHDNLKDDTNLPLQPGEEPWNDLIWQDGAPIARIDVTRELRFVGVAAAPWGEPAVYLRGGTKLYVLDFFSRKIYPVEVGANKPLIQGRMWQGAIVVTDGWNVFEYNPQAQTSRNIGLPSKWGIPPNLVGEDGPYQIIDLIPHDSELIALLVDIDEPASMLFRYNGLGWHQMGQRMHDFVAAYGFRTSFPLGHNVFTGGREQAIIVPGANLPTSPTSFGYWQFNLPTISKTPTIALDTFGPSGARFYTGWIDGGFFDIDGTLLRLSTDTFFNGTGQTLLTEYRIDNDPTSEETATWTQMTDVNGVADVFDASTLHLYFGTKAGAKFRTVQFRFTLTRGSDATLSPEVRAITLVYLKTPELRTQWTFSIDVNRMIETSATGDVETFYIDGAAATLANVWSKLRTMWINTHTLLSMTVPSGLNADESLFVKLTDIPMTFDDFRSAVAGKGTVQVTLLEPVN